MAQVSISKAAKLAGISRGSLYKTYLNKGLVSVSTDSAGKKCIDTSELLRVFGELKGDSEGDSRGDSQGDSCEQGYTGGLSPKQTEEKAQAIEIKMLREQVADLKADKAFYQAQVSELTNTMKLLEAPKQTQHPRHWWPFWK